MGVTSMPLQQNPMFERTVPRMISAGILTACSHQGQHTSATKTTYRTFHARRAERQMTDCQRGQLMTNFAPSFRSIANGSVEGTPSAMQASGISMRAFAWGCDFSCVTTV